MRPKSKTKNQRPITRYSVPFDAFTDMDIPDEFISYILHNVKRIRNLSRFVYIKWEVFNKAERRKMEVSS